MIRRHLRTLLLSLITCLCLDGTAMAAATPAPPVMQLGDAVRPLAYQLALTLEPGKEVFQGRITIDIALADARDFFWMNGQSLQIRSAVLTQDGNAYPARVSTGGTDFIGLQFAQPLHAGPARLAIDYSGRFENKNTRGLFRQSEGGNWYVLSQFEAVSARRAFPCFDEPHWKTPWTLALTVPRDDTAVSNMPQAAEELLPDGLKTVRFETTAPLPSYLVALGVGPFDVVDGGMAGMNGTHLRYITPKGRGAEVRYAASVTPRILALLENYFGRPYPFKKLDSLVIPETVNFGAMENVGLITYRSTLMLAKPGQENERFQQSYASVAAHEIAHQWFGDLVTMRWWTDVWLNESFATWMARKTMEQFNPAWDNNGSRERERQIAMLVDRLQSTRQIRQPVLAPDDLANAFDSITYDKGGAVLGMFESFLGESGFREGVRRYLKQHEYGNASAEDFFSAMTQADPRLGAGFASFVGQPGLPRVTATLDCSSQPTVALTQERFIAGKSGIQPGLAAAAATQTWTVPVCMRYPSSDGSRQFCTMLDQRTARVRLPDAAICPAWLLPNPGGIGYFLSGMTPEALASLANAPLRSAERVALSGDLSLQVRSAGFPIVPALQLAQRDIDDPDPEVALAAVNLVRSVNPAILDDADRDRFAAWIDRHFSRRARALGWLPVEGEADATRKLRSALLPLAVRLGRQADLREQASTLAMEWTASQDGSRLGIMLDPLLETAAFDGSPALQQALMTVARTSADRRVRGSAFGALGMFRDPELRARSFALLLSDRVDIREASNLMQTAATETPQTEALQAFLRANYDAVAARLPSESLARLPRYGSMLCSAAERTTFEGFYQQRLAQRAGGPRNLAQAVEAIDLCLAGRQMHRAPMAAFLAASH